MYSARFGCNDVAANRTWTAISANMATVKAGLPSGCKMFVWEVMPDSHASDTHAADIRALNANYATWCAANGATLILCHDEMGQVRTSTGELDDLKSAYSADGTHNNLAGKEKLGEIGFAVLDSFDWDA